MENWGAALSEERKEKRVAIQTVRPSALGSSGLSQILQDFPTCSCMILHLSILQQDLLAYTVTGTWYTARLPPKGRA